MKIRIVSYIVVASFLLGCIEDEKEHEFYSLFGLPNSNESIEKFKKKLGQLSDSSSYSDSFYLNYYDKGISLMLDKDEVLDAIYLYNENHENFHQYKGVIPYKIKFNDDINDVREKLGKHEDGSIPFPGNYNKAKWETKGIQVDILPKTELGDSKILAITLFKPKLEKEQ